jgi:hypothetical protein
MRLFGWFRSSSAPPLIRARVCDIAAITFNNGSERRFLCHWNDETQSDDNHWLYVTEWFAGEQPHLIVRTIDDSGVAVIARSDVRCVEYWRQKTMENA